jgi:hypothetical protein
MPHLAEGDLQFAVHRAASGSLRIFDIEILAAECERSIRLLTEGFWTKNSDQEAKQYFRHPARWRQNGDSDILSAYAIVGGE